MTVLPSGWAVAAVRELAADVSSGFASGRHNDDMVGIPHLRPMNVSRNGEIDLTHLKYVAPDAGSRRLESGDVLFNNTNSPALVGKTAVYGHRDSVAFSNHMTRLKLRDGMTPAFVARQLHYLWMSGGLSHLVSNHVNQASISSSRLASDVLLQVAPVAEQHRIVAAIEEAFSKLDAGEAGLRTVRQLLKRMRDAVLAAAVTGRLVPQDPTETPATELLADLGVAQRDRLGQDQAPAGWTCATLGDLVEPGRRIAYGVLQPGADFPGGVPMVRVMDLADGSVSVSALKRISPAIASKFPRTKLSGGEVLLSVVGTIGRVTVASERLRGANVARAVAVLPLRTEAVLPSWIACALRHEPWRRALEQSAHEVARKTLNLEDVRRFPIPIPPTAEQARIVEEAARQFSFIEACERAVDAGLARSAALRRSILKSAFEGKLVPQDPSDEPASVLLERIRAERAASEPKASARRRPGKVHP